MHIVTAAEVFPTDRRDAEKWKALPGAFNIDNIKEEHGIIDGPAIDDQFGYKWVDIKRIAIHPHMQDDET